ncbi:MAG: hypothetical protein J6R15_06465 [Bacteroidales bacterium]|nr:hypothetical protein [Bacteroidales bacterium]
MAAICLILFLLTASLWFLSNEYPVLFGIYVPTCAMKRVAFKAVAASALLLAVLLSLMLNVGDNMLEGAYTGFIDSQSLMIVILSALIILSVLKLFSISASSVYALIGAFGAYMISSGHEADYSVLLSYVAAPLAAFSLSAFLRYIADIALDRRHIHLITLSYYMRFAVIACIVLSALSLGLNWGGFLLAGAGVIYSASSGIWAVLMVLTLCIVLLSSFMRDGIDETAGRYEDFSIYAILSAGLSVSVVMIAFSFGFLGLKAVPLSPGTLVLSAIAGAEAVRKTQMVEREEYAKEALAFVLAPLGSLVIAYSIFYVSGSNEEHIVDFAVMAAAILVVAALAFAGYIRRQKAVKEATEKLVYTQQQQIYENSRALNDMELKVVLSENQALHNAIEMKRQEVMNVALSMVEQKEYLESLNLIVRKLSKAKDEQERDDLVSELSMSLRQRLSYERDVDSQYFYAQAESLHEDFNAKLSENFPDLTQQERRLATLLRLGFSSKYIATLMNITPKSVEISRYRLRQKLGLSKGDNLVNYIKSI